jgi:hypothetical protein
MRYRDTKVSQGHPIVLRVLGAWAVKLSRNYVAAGFSLRRHRLETCATKPF